MNVRKTAEGLTLWNKKCFGECAQDINTGIKRALATFSKGKGEYGPDSQGCKKQLTRRSSTNLIVVDRQLQQEMNDILKQEELLWYQQSC